eukprot:3217432-Pleurochrysis_carterae.AAC.1
MASQVKQWPRRLRPTRQSLAPALVAHDLPLALLLQMFSAVWPYFLLRLILLPKPPILTLLPPPILTLLPPPFLTLLPP